MCVFIKMEYLVANALVELYERKNIDKVSLEEIRKYGISVEESLINKNIRAILLYSNEYMKAFLDDYSDWFELDGDSIKIRSGKTTDDLRKYILSYVPTNIFLAMIKDSSLNTIFK